MELGKYIRSIPDYPKKGILFRDITTLIKNKDAFKETIDQLSKLASKIKLLYIELLDTETSLLIINF